jgi:hypothetical protein
MVLADDLDGNGEVEERLARGAFVCACMHAIAVAWCMHCRTCFSMEVYSSVTVYT